MPIAVAALAIAIFSVMDVLMKHLALGMGVLNAMLWRTGIALLFCVPLFVLRGGRLPKRGVLKLHGARGATAGLAVFLFFWGMTRMPMAEAIALSFVSPLLALLLAAIFLKEQVARSAVAASLLAFIGVLVIMAGQPASVSGAHDWRAPAAILVSACLYAVNLVIGRHLSQLAGPLESAVFFNIVTFSLYLCGAPWLAHTPVLGDLPWLALAALLSVFALMLVAWAYARAEAQRLLPTEYTAFLWAALLGYLVFGEAVTLATGVGAALIVVACLWAARAEPKVAEIAPALTG